METNETVGGRRDQSTTIADPSPARGSIPGGQRGRRTKGEAATTRSSRSSAGCEREESIGNEGDRLRSLTRPKRRKEEQRSSALLVRLRGVMSGIASNGSSEDRTFGGVCWTEDEDEGASCGTLSDGSSGIH
ncbi:uncharacterized protein LOC122196747 [Lactuca sativa]|uniref:uncharacterized protein LOC122196747 n=1 Tax=Lactuca sativa TaxID=4236 RepID=UPI001C688B16|nr:uncharacterized protein LOC122196747 [Lactuca sativa]